MEDTFRIAVTAMVFNNNGELLITKRKATKKRWPNKWTFPGGHVEKADYLGTPTEINNQWYFVFERAAKRETLEEVGLCICNTKYLCNIGIPDCFIISFTAELLGNEEVQLQSEECDEYAWVKPSDALAYDLIDGLADEIKLACSL